MSREQFQRKPLKFCGLGREKRLFEMHSHRSASRSERFSVGRPLAVHTNPPNDIPAGKASARLESLKKLKEEKMLKKMSDMKKINPPFKAGGKFFTGSFTSTSTLSSNPQSSLPKKSIQKKTGSIVSRIANPNSTQTKLKAGNCSKSLTSQVKTQSKIVNDRCHNIRIPENEVATDAGTIEPIQPRKSFAPDNFVFNFPVEPVKAELSNNRFSTPIKETEGETHSGTNETIVVPKNLQSLLPDNGAEAIKDIITEQESDIVISKDVQENNLTTRVDETICSSTIEDKAPVEKGFRPLQLDSIAECSESPTVTSRSRSKKLLEGFIPRRSPRLAQKIACKDTTPSPVDSRMRHVTLRRPARNLKLSESWESIFEPDFCPPDASYESRSTRPSCSNLIEGIEDLHLDNTFQVFDPVNTRKISLLGTPPRKGRRSAVLENIGQDLISFSPF